MASRLNIVDYVETEPISPSSHAVIQLADRKRRPRRGERSLASVENVAAAAERRSPRPDPGELSPSVGVDTRATGPAGWAVTETGPGPEKDRNQCRAEWVNPYTVT